jgi:hypothetical protein
MTPSKRSAKPRIQISLAALLVLFSLCTLWLGLVAHSARNVGTVVAFVSRHDGELFYLHQRAANGRQHSQDEEIDERRRHVAGYALPPGWFVDVDEINLSGADVTDDDLPLLRSVSRLRILNLASTAITDEALETIGQMPCLRALDLRNTNITDVGIASLKRSPQLSELLLGYRHHRRGVKAIVGASQFDVCGTRRHRGDPSRTGGL